MGLLDGLMGDSWDDPRTQAMLALSAGLLSNNGSKGLSAGLLGAGQAFQGAKESEAKRKLQLAQAEDALQQVELRKQQAAQAERQNSMIANWMGQLNDAIPAANQRVIQQTGNLAPTNTNAAIQQQAIAQSNQGNPLSGIDRQALMANLALNGGKDISGWIYDRTKPNMQMHNGVAMDMNRVQPGTSMPQVDNTGRGYQIIPDQTAPGGFRVAAPAGAVDLYKQYRGIDEGIKNANTPVDVFDQSRGAMVKRTQQQVLDAANGGARIGEVANPWVGDPAQARAAIMAMRDPQARAEALRQFTEAQGAGPMQSGPSTAEKIAAEAATKKAVDLAGGEATRQNERTEKGNTASDALGMIQRARDILQVGSPTASGFGSLVDSGLGVVGVSTKGAESAAKLDSIAGWLTSNVPRMQGPQSDRDVAQYKIMAARVGDRTVPVAQRLAALDEVQAIQTKYAQNSERQIAPQEGRSWGNASPAPSIPPAAAAALRMFKNDPQKRAEFDAKFGPGAAASILGQ